MTSTLGTDSFQSVARDADDVLRMLKRSMHYVASAALVMDAESAQRALVFLREARELVNRVEKR